MRKKPTSQRKTETLFVLRAVGEGKDKLVEWKIRKPTLRRQTEIYGHLKIILEDLEKDIKAQWEITPGLDGPMEGKADTRYIG